MDGDLVFLSYFLCVCVNLFLFFYIYLNTDECDLSLLLVGFCFFVSTLYEITLLLRFRYVRFLFGRSSILHRTPHFSTKHNGLLCLTYFDGASTAITKKVMKLKLNKRFSIIST